MRDWEQLSRLLDARLPSGEPLALWWRDDDAVTASPQLERLLELAARHACPLALAVIPATASQALAPLLTAQPGIWVLQHGYSHTNYAPPDEKRQELWDGRPLTQMSSELTQGAARLRAVARDRALPVLVPPWNRLGARIAARLGALGYRGLSTFSGPFAALAPSGVRQVNCHLDPIDWRRRAFAGTAAVLEPLLLALQARSAGPLGLLSHHLVHDAGVWELLDRLLTLTARHPAVRWLPAPLVFGLEPSTCARSA
jgi:peptidoglycan/xylan/chitin deacetylase (PgdA/CDA1 family)